MLARHRETPADPAVTSLGAGRRTLILLALVAVAGAPAAVLRGFCAGHSCDEPASASTEVPFCSLPGDVRARVAAGFREGRSPDVLAVAAEPDLLAGDEGTAVPWPSSSGGEATRVPLAFSGAGLSSERVEIAPGAGLDDVAPTIAEILGFDRPHPDVRSGTAIEGVAGEGRPPRLVVQVVWVGRGSDDLRKGPAVEELMASGPSTLDADTGSVPVDPAAVLTTIGTGGLPSQHGITGTYVRDDAGKLRKAWSPNSPVSVIATLGDDLDEEMGQEPVIGMAGARRSYLGAIGGNWYIDVDRDRFVKTEPGREPRDARRLLDSSFGADSVPDLAVVAVEGGWKTLDEVLRVVLRRGAEVSGGSVAVVFTATGATGRGEVFDPSSLPGDEIEPLVERAVPGGLFLDQEELARRRVSEDVVLRSLVAARDRSGDALFADAFPAIAVAFGRYC
ncbi:MAG TPA: hypothetical protein VHN37_16485 [Actinomycetota bacterium]|nr:hypothetical protein [Actinomycetota bacterium]